MRLTIVRSDNMIIKDGLGYIADLSIFDDLSWVEGYDQKSWGKFHALQWYGDPDEDGEYGFGQDEPYGEVEFKKTVPNLIIKELGVYEQALSLWEASKLAEEERIAAEEAEAQRLREEEEARIRDAYLELDMQTMLSNNVTDEDAVALQLEEDLEKLLADL
jgi:hypothetical protein